MFWKKTAKISAICVGVLGIIDILWRTITKWVYVGHYLSYIKDITSSSYYSSRYSGPYPIDSKVVYGGVNAVLLSIVEFVLVAASILLVVSVIAMLIDIFNRVHNINEPTLLADIVNRSKKVPYNPYGQQMPMNNMGVQQPMPMQQYPQQPMPPMNQQPVGVGMGNNPMNNMGIQQQMPMQQPVNNVPPVTNPVQTPVAANNNGTWTCSCGQVNPEEATFCSKCYLLKK